MGDVACEFCIFNTDPSPGVTRADHVLRHRGVTPKRSLRGAIKSSTRFTVVDVHTQETRALVAPALIVFIVAN